MALRHKLTYHRRLFLLLLAFSWVMVACFVAFQYGREKHFKAEKLDGQLQLFNMRLLDAIGNGISAERFIAENDLPCPDLRVSVINDDGQVIFDNSLDKLPSGNHLSRPEIADALVDGTGYTIRRHSASTDCNYFYSAMEGDGVVVRSAVPYSVSLHELLAVDSGFLWFMSGVTLLLSIAGYVAARRIGYTIYRLNQFAQKAERGEPIYADEAFPNDELGDISGHIVRLYAQLQQTTADLHREHQRTLHEEKEKIRIKKQLTNNINHELRTPVASIQICLETLQSKKGLDADVHDDLIDRCSANCNRLRRLLDDVSVITRMDDGAEQIHKEKMVLNDVINDIVDEMNLRPLDKRMNIHVDFVERLELFGNHSALASAFRNLVDNAVAYSGGQNIYIRLLKNDDRHIELAFEDDGCGVGQQHLPRLFERFYRIDKGRSRRSGGTGLGLSIVKHSVLLHGGEIRVENRMPHGLIFTFTLMKY